MADEQSDDNNESDKAQTGGSGGNNDPPQSAWLNLLIPTKKASASHQATIIAPIKWVWLPGWEFK